MGLAKFTRKRYKLSTRSIHTLNDLLCLYETASTVSLSLFLSFSLSLSLSAICVRRKPRGLSHSRNKNRKKGGGTKQGPFWKCVTKKRHILKKRIFFVTRFVFLILGHQTQVLIFFKFKAELNQVSNKAVNPALERNCIQRSPPIDTSIVDFW